MTGPRYFMDEEDRRQNDINIFVRDASPGEWRSLAGEFRDSAELLWNDRSNGLRGVLAQRTEAVDGELRVVNETKKIYSVSRSYFLLAGFALENLLKGFIVALDPTLITDGKLNPQLKTHKLTTLVDKIEELELTESELRFCSVAEKAIPYWGRYPVPLSFNNLVPEVGLTAELRNGFLSLFDRLDEKLYMEIRDGWNPGNGAGSDVTWDAKYDSKERLDKIRRKGKSSRDENEI